MEANINETLKSATNTARERLSSPFYGPFILSWIIWNWKIWYITFFVSENAIPNKMQYICANLIDWCYSLGCPLSTTIFLILVSPVVTRKAAQYIEWQKTLSKENMDSIAKGIAVPKDKHNKVEKELTELKQTHSGVVKEFYDQKKEIEGLHNTIKANGVVMNNLRDDFKRVLSFWKDENNQLHICNFFDNIEVRGTDLPRTTLTVQINGMFIRDNIDVAKFLNNNNIIDKKIDLADNVMSTVFPQLTDFGAMVYYTYKYFKK